MLPIHRGERVPVLVAALLFFFVLGGYFILRPVRDALAIDDDPWKIPWLFTATFVTMLAVAPLWGGLVARWPRRRFVPVAYHAFVVQLLLLFVLMRGEVGGVWLGKVFYVWVSVYNLFVVSVFWSLCADLFTSEQGKRLFGPIAAGGTAGALAGPLVTTTLVEHVGVPGLLVVAAGMLEAAVVCALVLDKIGGEGGRADEPVGGGAIAGLEKVARSRYLRTIGLYVILTTVAATFLYLKQAEIAKAGFETREARTAFFARVDLWVNSAVIGVQFLLAARLLGWLGVGAMLAALPLVQMGGLWALAAAPTVAVLVAVQVAGRTATHALTRPAREVLFTVVPREDKYKAKNVIDTLIFRFGDMGSAWFYVGLGALGFGGVGLALLAVPMIVVWLFVAAWLGRAYRNHTSSRDHSDPLATR
jgi:AAA family ATP:ADP antiporter